MDALAEVIGQNMEIVFSINGLAWYTLGLAIILTPKKHRDLALSRSLPWLAAFAFVHGIVEWLDMLSTMPSQALPLAASPALPPLKAALLGISATLLLQFGATLTAQLSGHSILRLAPPTLFILWLASPLYIGHLPQAASGPFSAAVPAGTSSCLNCHWLQPTNLALDFASTDRVHPDTVATLQVFARYLLYLPGLALSALGFLLQARIFRSWNLPQIAADAERTSLVFGINVFFAGMIVAPAPYFPANVLNYDTFVRLLVIPPQVFHTAMAALSSILITRLLRFYTLERDREIEEERQKRLLAQEELANTLSVRVSELTREITALHTFGRRIIANRDAHAVLRGLANVISRLLRADACAVYMLDDCQRPVLVSSHGGTENGPLPFQAGPSSGPSMISVLLTARGETLGTIVIHAADGRFKDSDKTLLETIADQAAVALQNSRLLLKVSEQSIRDSLTGLFNHRYFHERLQEELSIAVINHSVLSLLFCDLDEFKAFNDLNGHTLGDKALKDVARIITECARTSDIVARYGGEEFTVILPDTTAPQALAVAERIRKGIANHVFEARVSSHSHLTISIGIAEFPTDASDKAELIDKADRAMYTAKQRGRNQICVFSADSQCSSTAPHPFADELHLSTVHALAAAVDARDHYTGEHSERVAAYATAIANELGLSEEAVAELKVAALLHDIGKIAIRDEILHKQGPLGDDEWPIVRQHPQLGEDILKRVQSLLHVARYVRHHHERYDGKGYPDGLAGKEIPLLARIIAVADAFHAMISHRPYRAALSLEQAIAELERNAGGQFDPVVVQAFLAALRKEQLVTNSEAKTIVAASSEPAPS